MTQVDEATSVVLVARDGYLQAKKQAAQLALEGHRILVFCDEATMRLWMASLARHQELQQTQPHKL